jgi:hypothetical protein
MAEEPEKTPDDLLSEIRRTNVLLAKLIRTNTDWRLALRQGLMTGLGGVIGATVLVSIMLWLIQPLKRLDALKPTLERISRQLEAGNETRSR